MCVNVPDESERTGRLRIASDECSARPCAGLEGSRERWKELDGLDLLDAPRARAMMAMRSDSDRLVDAVRHENDGLEFPQRPDLERLILRLLRRQPWISDGTDAEHLGSAFVPGQVHDLALRQPERASGSEGDRAACQSRVDGFPAVRKARCHYCAVPRNCQ